jgi:hypothetical protein
MILPTNVAPITVVFPWSTEIAWTPCTEVEVVWVRGAIRNYSPSMQVCEYDDAGPARLRVAVACNRYCWEDATQPQFDAVVRELLAAAARYLLSAVVRTFVPAGYPLPTGLGWPLTAEVGTHLDTGVGTIPTPRGAYAAFRLLPVAAYGTTTVAVDPYRGEEPPV